MNTSYNENLEKIRSHRVTPPSSAWRVIREKLARDRSRRKAASYRNMAIAACFLALLAITFTLLNQFPSSDTDTHLVASQMIIEDLPVVENDPYYNWDKLIVIKEGQYFFK